MTALFDKALALVLKTEGGKVDDPRDHGGRTNEGVTQVVFTAWLKKQGKINRDVYLITAAEVSAIYKTQYADVVKFDELPAGLGYAVFDAAVNSGPVQAAKWLQRAVKVKDDGHVGILTLAAVESADTAATIREISVERLAFLKDLDNWDTFGKGWTTRVDSVEAAAIAMIGTHFVAVEPPIVAKSILEQATAKPPVVTPVTFMERLRAFFNPRKT